MALTGNAALLDFNDGGVKSDLSLVKRLQLTGEHYLQGAAPCRLDVPANINQDDRKKRSCLLSFKADMLPDARSGRSEIRVVQW